MVMPTTGKNTDREKLITGKFLETNREAEGISLFSPLKTIRGCGKMLVINIILMFRGKMNELKAENGLKWNMWFWLSAFYYVYFIRKTGFKGRSIGLRGGKKELHVTV